MLSITPYLGFQNGRCREALNFYQQCVGGEISCCMTFAGTPVENETNKDQVMHAALSINGKPVLMASDGCGDCGDGKQVAHGPPSAANSLSACFATEADADAAFAKLLVGGSVLMPLEHQFWGAKFGMLTDKYGFVWMISNHPSEAGSNN